MSSKILMKTIGANIHRLRKAHRMTQDNLAEALNRTPGAISHIEKGSSIIGVELLVKIADLFSVSVDELVSPPNSSSHFQNITHLLSTQPEDALAALEPFIKLWIAQYGEPRFPAEKEGQ